MSTYTYYYCPKCHFCSSKLGICPRCGIKLDAQQESEQG